LISSEPCEISDKTIEEFGSTDPTLSLGFGVGAASMTVGVLPFPS